MPNAPQKRSKTDGVTRPKIKHTILKQELCPSCGQTILRCTIGGWPRVLDPTPLNELGVLAAANRQLYVRTGMYADVRDNWNQHKGFGGADTVHADHFCHVVTPLVLARNIVAETAKPKPADQGEPNF